MSGACPGVSAPDYNAAMLLRTLGGLDLIPSSFARPKPLLLLAYLALEGSQERRHLANLFWHGATDPLNRLAVTLTRLRRADPGIVGANNIRVWTDLTTDAQTLLTALEQARFEEVLDLYRGSFLEGIDFDDWGSELADWSYGTRDFLASQVKTAHLAVAEAEASRGEFQSAAKRAEAACRVAQTSGLDPNDIARLHTLLLAGDHPRRHILEKEAEAFGVKLLTTPNEAKGVLKCVPIAARDIPNNLPHRGSSFVGRDPELGEIVQLLAQQHYRLLTLTGLGGVGKTRLALQAASDLLKQEQFEDGIFFVPLVALDSPSLIASSVAAVLELELSSHEEPLAQVIDRLRGRRILLILDNYEHLLEGAELVSGLLRECPDLKVLVTSRERIDLTEEHVFVLEGLAYPAGGNSPPANQVHYDAVQLFLQRARTIRPDFGVAGVDLSSVLIICRLVEGLPLALELAAAWVRLLSPIEIAQEIEKSLDLFSTSTRDIPGRHRSLCAAFEHSWQLLTLGEQEVLRKLSVFQGGFSRMAASEVSGATIPLLAALVDKSLMRVDLTGRYDFHPLIHQFIGRKLAENSEEQLSAKAAHATYFVSLAEEAEPQLYTSAQSIWLGRIEKEFNNFRAVLDWAEQTRQAFPGLQVAKVSGEFCLIRGFCSEGRKLMNHALTLPGASVPTQLRASVLRLAGLLAWMQSDTSLARSFHEESLTISQELGDKAGLASTLCSLGNVCIEEGDFHAARSHCEESLKLFQALQNPYGTVSALSNLGFVTFSEGDLVLAQSIYEECLARSRELENEYQIHILLHALGETIAHQGELGSARSLLEESLKISRKVGSKWNMINTLNRLGQVATKQGDLLPARTFLREGMALSQRIWDRWGMIYTIESFASLARAMGDMRQTVRLWSAAEALRKGLGSPLLPDDLPRYHKDLAEALSQLGEAVFNAEWGEGRLLSREQAIACALSLT